MALKTRPPDQLSSAAIALDIDNRPNDGAYLKSTVATGRGAGRDAWDWYNKIGEVHYAISRTGRVAGYTRFQAVRFAPNGEVEEIIDKGPAAEAAMSIYSLYGGVRGFVERYYTLLKVPGDMYLTQMLDGAGEPDGFHLASPDELDVSSFSRWGNKRDTIKSIRLRTVPGSTGSDTETIQPFSKELKSSQLLGRIWSPSKRWADVPESALQALHTECEVLHDLTLSMKAQLRSRFALAGILFLPPGVSIATTAKGRSRVGGQLTEPTLDLILAAMTKNVKTYDDATTLLPIILKGTNPEDGERIKHIVLDRKIFETDLELRKELIGRILQSLDSNQDQVEGNSNQSHWGSWSSADDERRVAVGPDIESLCWSLGRLVMQPYMAREAILNNRPVREPGNVGLWYDLTRAATKSNPQEDARQAWDRILIGDKPARRMAGISETDKPSDEEQVRGVGRLTRNPMLMLYGTPEYDKIDWDMVAKMPKTTGPAEDSPGDKPESGPGKGAPGSPDDGDRETDTPRTQRPA